MNSCKLYINNNKSKDIPISKTSPTHKKVEFNNFQNEYSLKQNFFDPSKSSPPNEFMLKLRLRMTYYDSFNNVDNLINE
jgi:hypothetical protein